MIRFDYIKKVRFEQKLKKAKQTSREKFQEERKGKANVSKIGVFTWHISRVTRAANVAGEVNQESRLTKGFIYSHSRPGIYLVLNPFTVG